MYPSRLSPQVLLVPAFLLAFVARKLRFCAIDGKGGSAAPFGGAFWRHKNLKNRTMGLSKAGLR
jgi:hypothetical protein